MLRPAGDAMTISLRVRLVAPTVICLAGIVALATGAAVDRVDRYRVLQEIQRMAPLLRSASVIGATAGYDEGAASVGLGVADTPENRQRLVRSRAALDDAIATLKANVASIAIDDAAAAQDIAFILDRYAGLPAFRARVDARQLSATDVVAFLQPVAPRAFDFIQRSATRSKDAAIGHAINGLYALLQFADGTHMENCAAFPAASGAKVSEGDRDTSIAGVQTQDLFAAEVLSTAPPDVARDFDASLKGPAAATIQRARAMIVASAGGQAPPEGAAWIAALLQRSETLAGLISRYERQLSDSIGAAAAAAWASLLVSLGTGAGILLVASMISVWSIRYMSRRLTAIAGTMERLAAGDLDGAVTDVDRRDEIGAMARAVDVFRTAALRSRQLEMEAHDVRHRGEAMRIEAQRQAEQTAQEQLERVTATFARSLHRLAGGDLSCEIDVPLSSQFEALRHDFNDAVTRLRTALGHVSAAADTIGAGSDDIHAAAGDLSRRTEQQAASLEQTAAALDEITGHVRKTADAAGQARRFVSNTTVNAERSEGVVGRAVEAMEAIETSSREIGQIIGVIDEIAFQTNLLALNAGVEAARAGDAGRGFAVVASEVRALAQRSAAAAKQIKALISTSSGLVGQGVALVGQTGDALRTIATEIGEIKTVVNVIASSAQEQATGLDQINIAIAEMDRATQQNTAMVEETTAAVGNLSSESHALRDIVRQFKVSRGPVAGLRAAA